MSSLVNEVQPYNLRETSFNHRHLNKVQLTVPREEQISLATDFCPRSISNWNSLSFDSLSLSSYVQLLRPSLFMYCHYELSARL